MGGNCTKKDHLGGNFTPRYVAEHFTLHVEEDWATLEEGKGTKPKNVFWDQR